MVIAKWTRELVTFPRAQALSLNLLGPSPSPIGESEQYSHRPTYSLAKPEDPKARTSSSSQSALASMTTGVLRGLPATRRMCRAPREGPIYPCVDTASQDCVCLGRALHQGSSSTCFSPACNCELQKLTCPKRAGSCQSLPEPGLEDGIKEAQPLHAGLQGRAPTLKGLLLACLSQAISPGQCRRPLLANKDF
jgi:hypothetical protein